MEDKYLTVVEEHVDRLGEMAKNIQEELQIQDRMVDDLGNRIDTAQEHVGNVNTRMKVSQLTNTFGSLARLHWEKGQRMPPPTGFSETASQELLR